MASFTRPVANPPKGGATAPKRDEMMSRQFHSMWRLNTLPPEAQKAVDDLCEARAKGTMQGLYRDRLTLIVNSMFRRDDRGHLTVTTDAPVFEEIRQRSQTTRVNQYQNGAM